MVPMEVTGHNLKTYLPLGEEGMFANVMCYSLFPCGTNLNYIIKLGVHPFTYFLLYPAAETPADHPHNL